MRKGVLITGILVLLALLITVLWWKSPHRRQELKTVESVEDGSRRLSFAQTNGTPVTSSKSNDLFKPTNSASATTSRQEIIRQEMEAQNVPVEFYGKVVDQDGNSLPGARIAAHARHWNVFAPVAFGATGSSIPINTTSDSTGLFKLEGVTGDVLGIDGLTKPGYEVEITLLHNYGAKSGTLNEPILFTMWSTNIHEALINSSRSFQITSDGKPYFIDLDKGKLSETSEGDLKIWIRYPTNTIQGQTYDWACEIAALKGGLLEETNGTSMYIAPVDEYQTSFQLQYQIKGGQRGSSGERRFYLKLKNGQEYGRMKIALFAPYNRIPALIRIQYAVNPTGSRVLK